MLGKPVPEGALFWQAASNVGNLRPALRAEQTTAARLHRLFESDAPSAVYDKAKCSCSCSIRYKPKAAGDVARYLSEAVR